MDVAIKGNGQSRIKERKTANLLYVSIGIALLVFAALFLMLPRNIGSPPAAIKVEQSQPQAPANPGPGVPESQP